MSAIIFVPQRCSSEWLGVSFERGAWTVSFVALESPLRNASLDDPDGGAPTDLVGYVLTSVCGEMDSSWWPRKMASGVKLSMRFSKPRACEQKSISVTVVVPTRCSGDRSGVRFQPGT